MRKRLVLTTAVILLLTSGVAGAGLLPLSYKASAPKANAKGSSSRGIKAVVSANNAFAFDLYSELRKSETENMFYSPYSMSAALAMTYEGARGKTAAEMKSVLHFPNSSVLRSNFAAIYNGINKASNSYKLKTGNALWVQKQFPLLEKYIKRVKSYYAARASNLDFVHQTERSRLTINRYIAAQTNNRIKNLIAKGYLGRDSRFVLTNAIYFKGAWRWEFDPRLTYQGDFRITPEKIVKTPMMFMSSTEVAFNYANTKDLQILELPYKGNKVSMLVLLPHTDLDSIERSLTASKVKQYRAKMKPTIMDSIMLPKFEFDSKYELNSALSKMGMPTAFTDRADFSGMTGRRELSLAFVLHQAYVKVDEKGTEATGATAVGGGVTSVRITNDFHANHPFLFLIQEKKTGNILFLGRVVDPTS